MMQTTPIIYMNVNDYLAMFRQEQEPLEDTPEDLTVSEEEGEKLTEAEADELKERIAELRLQIQSARVELAMLEARHNE